jgi:histone demethylase JARID1
MNFSEYKQFADKFYEEIYNNEKININKIENDFWRLCSKKDAKLANLKTRYAADVSFKKYISDQEIEKITNKLAEDNQWTLLNINLQKNSLFQFLKREKNSNISGLTVPWLYFGMLFSTFCWHVEDLYLYSLNNMYYGSPKIWYSISSSQKEKMDAYIKQKMQKEIKADPFLMHKLILLIDPNELTRNGIKVFRTVQHPGEIIITKPKAYHAGFSTGFNIAEAVNFSVK